VKSKAKKVIIPSVGRELEKVRRSLAGILAEFGPKSAEARVAGRLVKLQEDLAELTRQHPELLRAIKV
jgi:hypothetical protein